MIVCASSASTLRYRDDILRCLSLPAGAWIRFRYSESLISPTIRKDWSILTKKRVLVVYFDASENGAHYVLPIRWGTIRATGIHGSTYWLEFELAEYAECGDSNSFSNVVCNGPEALLNFRLSAEEGTLVNYDGGIAERFVTVGNFKVWERLVSSICEREQFKAVPFFYCISQIRPQNRYSGPKFKSGRCICGPQSLFDFEIYHFHPRETPVEGVLSCGTTNPSVEWLTPAEMSVDSGYDVKKCTLSTPEALAGIQSVLLFNTSHRAGNGIDWTAELPIEVPHSISRRILTGLLIAAALSVAGLTTALEASVLWKCIVVLISSLIAGQLVVFNRKDFY